MSNHLHREKEEETMTQGIDYIKEYLDGKDYMTSSFEERIAAMQKLRRDIASGKYD